jgi:hypothetical protein
MPMMLSDLVELNNQIVALNQQFDSANEGQINLTVDNVVDSIMTILPLYKSADVQIDSTADLSVIVSALGSLQAITNLAKIGLEKVDPQLIIQVVSMMLSLIVTPPPPENIGDGAKEKKTTVTSHETHKEVPKQPAKT